MDVLCIPQLCNNRSIVGPKKRTFHRYTCKARLTLCMQRRQCNDTHTHTQETFGKVCKYEKTDALTESIVFG